MIIEDGVFVVFSVVIFIFIAVICLPVGWLLALFAFSDDQISRSYSDIPFKWTNSLIMTAIYGIVSVVLFIFLITIGIPQ